MRTMVRFGLRSPPRGLALFSLVLTYIVASVGHTARADWKDDIGYTQLVQELTDLSIPPPTGAGIVVTQVEAEEPDTSNYRPNPSNAEFTYPPLAKTFVYKTTTETGISGHATTVGTYLYGNTTSIAPGVATVNCWEASDWVYNGLKLLTTPAPVVEDGDVANFSWIGSLGPNSYDAEALKRLDFQINRDDFVATVAMNNGSSTTLPNLLGQGYNTISVGLSNGNHTHGTTTLDGTSRMKPDIVAPASYTSYATPIVGAAAAMLLEPAKAMSADAAHSQTIKAILMAGATKTSGAGGLAGAWSHTQTQPLDATYGAGQLNVDRSYHILTAGQQAASGSQLVNPTGWDFGTYSGSLPGFYFFDVSADTTLTELSAVLTWNAAVSRSGSTYTTTLANLDLSLYSVSGFDVGALVDQSISAVDNVELISLTDLAPGRYALSVSGGTDEASYGLAWFADSPDVTWIGAGSTTWSTVTGSTNWKKTLNGMSADYTDGYSVTFNDSAMRTAIEISASDVAPANVTFTNTDKDFTVTGEYGIVGAGASVTKLGRGTVTIGTVNAYGGKTTVEAGTLVLQGRTKAMSPVLDGSGANIIGGLLMLDYSGEDSPAATVDTLMKASYDPKGENHFDIGKFISTAADNDYGLGWKDDTTAEQITVAYTLYGDATLDGVVNLADLGFLGDNYGATTGATWAMGDFNYDGMVNLTDLGLIGDHWNQGIVLITPVPEPSSVAMLAWLAALVGVWTIGRRRNFGRPVSERDAEPGAARRRVVPSLTGRKTPCRPRPVDSETTETAVARRSTGLPAIPRCVIYLVMRRGVARRMLSYSPAPDGQQSENPHKMCGIVGYIGPRNAAEFLVVGLRRLEYRGYDSAGVATITPDGELAVVKAAGRIDRLEARLTQQPAAGQVGIGHTRWATHGAPSDVNAHPHVGGDNAVAVVHNGVIENFQGLKLRLAKEGYEFKSATDSEVIAHLVDSCLKRRPPVADMAAADYQPLVDAVQAALRSFTERMDWRSFSGSGPRSSSPPVWAAR